MAEKPATYGSLHAGDRILSAEDGGVWDVVLVVHVPYLTVVAKQGDVEVTGYPAPGAPVTVAERADVSKEAAAHAVLVAGFGQIEVLGEKWN